MKFTEEKLEKAFTELLGEEGFLHHIGASLAGARKADEVLIEEDLRHFLQTQYACQGISTPPLRRENLHFTSSPPSQSLKER